MRMTIKKSFTVTILGDILVTGTTRGQTINFVHSIRTENFKEAGPRKCPHQVDIFRDLSFFGDRHHMSDFT